MTDNQEAQSAHVGPVALSTPEVGAASVEVAPANPRRLALYVFNPNDKVTLWVSPTGTEAASSGAGSIALEPHQSRMFDDPPWTNGMNAIASGDGTTSITVLEY
jgi:hypothetical protein